MSTETATPEAPKAPREYIAENGTPHPLAVPPSAPEPAPETPSENHETNQSENQ